MVMGECILQSSFEAFKGFPWSVSRFLTMGSGGVLATSSLLDLQMSASAMGVLFGRKRDGLFKITWIHPD